MIESSSTAFLRGTDPAPGADLKVYLARLHAEVGRRIHNPPSPDSIDFFSSAVRSIGRIKGGANVDARIKCLIDCASFFYFNGRNPELLATVRQLDELARRSRSLHWARLIQTFGGIVHGDMGNLAEAVVRHSEALKIARHAGEPKGEVSTFCNLGVALIYGGLFKEAIPCLQRAIELSGLYPEVNNSHIGAHPRYFECASLTNLAQCYQHTGNHEEALVAIRRCLALTPTPTDSITATNYVLREATFVRIALDLGMTREAREHLDVCMTYSPQAGSRGRMITTMSQGLYEVHAGDVRDGISILEGVLRESAIVVSLRMNTLMALAMAEDKIGQPEQALRYIELAVNEVREARKKTAIALLSNGESGAVNAMTSESDDLQRYQLAQVTYRLRAAERKALNAQMETLERLAITADLKEEASGGHGHRVGRLASLFAKQLGLPPDDCHNLDLAGRLHDIGKIGLPDRIMLKAETLREAERQIVSAHPKIGAEILAQGLEGPLQMAREVAMFHHEAWDGSGYPSGLAGIRIPLHARIVALADVFDAMTHGRPYAPAWSVAVALEEIRKRNGTQFDPTIGQRFVDFVAELHAAHPDLDGYLGQSAQNTIFSRARERIGRLLQDGGEPRATEAGASA